ncbi:Gfo/Idh/MocA family protein [Streptomyces sp. NPDC014805]|uniref:Gfo/Idh/MocA family protein n=1 Tax=Streptomyces sp. NPDC014805 TaxID=3364919 RepID=UPI003701426B
MLQPLVVGLGRSGSGLHLRTLVRLARRSAAAGDPLVALPAVGCDPRARALRPLGAPGEVTVVAALEEALAHVDPARTVAHVCTPPRLRHELIAELAGHGVRRLIVEKPLATSPDELDALVRLRQEAGLDLVVVAHWTSSRLAARLRRLIRGRHLGALRRITVDQHKPRFQRSLTSDGHTSALDVEIPHSLALALDLAGPAELRTARCWDLLCEDRRLPGLGGAHVELEHRSGVVTLLRSDLGAPVRQRSVVCAFEGGTVTAHFPLSEDDDHAQLLVVPFDRGPQPPGDGLPGGPGAVAGAGHHVFRDDALTAFLEDTYRGFATGGAGTAGGTGAAQGAGTAGGAGAAQGAGAAGFPLACAATRLLCAARERSAAVPPVRAGSR